MSDADDVDRLARDTAPFGGSLGTEDLPDDVVAQELVCMVWLTTRVDKPRRGVLAYAVNIGGRENPELTADEREYVAATLTRAAKAVRDG